MCSQKYFHGRDLPDRLLENNLGICKSMLILKLLGVPVDDLENIYKRATDEELNNKLSIVEVMEQKPGSRDNYRDELPELIETITLELLRDNYSTNTKYYHNHFDLQWLSFVEDLPMRNSEKTAPTTCYILDKQDDLQLHVWNDINTVRKKDYINLVILCPLKTNSLISDLEKGKLVWDIFDGTLDVSESREIDQYALIVAIQLLGLGDVGETTCSELIKRTFLKRNFEIVEGFDKDVESNNNIILRSQSEDDAPNLDISSLSTAYNKNNIGSLIKSKFIDGSPLFKKKTVPNRDPELLSLTSGLRYLMSMVPGVLCRIKVPVERSKGERRSQKSNTWVLGPKNWLELIKKPNVDNLTDDINHKDELFNKDGTQKPVLYI